MLTIRDIHKAFGRKEVLRGVSFEVQTGEIVALLGESGSGKSTLLSIIAGLETADRGQVLWDGADVGNMPIHQRGFGLMFQDYALFPHRNVHDNVAFGLQMAGVARKIIDDRVYAILDMVDLYGFAKRDIANLSGGEQQRVALARALAPEPRLLMLDEPLGSLDRNLRAELGSNLRWTLSTAGQTSLYVTHDQEEAFAVADRVVILYEGRVEQIGAPRDLYLNPATPYVARFLGLNNVFRARADSESGSPMLYTDLARIPWGFDLPVGEFQILIRPDALTVGAAGPAVITGKLKNVQFRGLLQRIEISFDRHSSLQFEVPAGVELPDVGSSISVSFNPKEAIQVFERD